MKKIYLFLALVILSSSVCNASGLLLPLGVKTTIIDPELGNEDATTHRTPVRIPTVSIEDYTLYFDTPCDGCELRVVDANDNVVYSTTIPAGCTSLQLPTTLSGTYELQIIRGIFCFYGNIDL